MALIITEDNFEEEVINADQPVLVDFWAEWCGPCKMISPMVDAVASEVEGVAKVGKCNLDDGQAIAAKYGIKSIPTLLFFKGGEVKDQIVGANVTQSQISGKLKALA
jgi:thioredoxin 1